MIEMIDKMLPTISDINLQAIAKMRVDRYEEAIHMLIHALRLVNSRDCSLPLHSIYTKTFQGDAMTVVIDKDYSSSESRETMIYRKAFLIPTDEETIGVASGVLLFNIGLACQRCWMRSYKSVMLQKSLEFYNSSLLRIQNDGSIDDDLSDLKWTLLAALYHNMAIGHEEVYEIGKTRIYRLELIRILDFDDFELFLDEDDRKFFRFGIFCAKYDDFRLAPAA